MNLTQEQKEYQQLVALSFGSVFAAAIACLWSGIFLALLGGTAQKAAIAVTVALDLLCLGLSLYLLIARRPRERQSLPYLRSGKFWTKFYGVIGLEIIVIYLLIAFFQARGVDNIVFPIIVLIVGLHFYPLAHWNGNTLWYGTATVLTLAMISLLAFVSHQATTTLLGAPGSDTWSVISTGVMVASMIVMSLLSSWQYIRKRG